MTVHLKFFCKKRFMTLFVKLPGLPASLSVALIAPITSNVELMVHRACLHGDDAKNDVTFNVLILITHFTPFITTLSKANILFKRLI